DRARSAIDLHEAKVAALQEDALARVGRADMADWEREQWLQSFTDGFDSTRPIFQQRHALHRRLLDIQEQQVDVLERAGAWRVSGAGIEFADPSDQAAFNDLARQLSATQAELEALERRAEAVNAEYEERRPRY